MQNDPVNEPTRSLEFGDGAFIRATAHALTGPAATLAGFTALLSERVDDLAIVDEALAAHVTTLERLTTRLSQLSRGLARYAAAGVVYASEPVDIAGCIRRACDLSETDRPADVELTIDADVDAHVDGSENQLTLMIGELVRNAIRFGVEERPLSVHVSATVEGPHVIICVQDNGIGVDEEFLAVAFEPYRKLQSSGGPGGAGLGLTIAQRIAGLHGGRVWLESDGDIGATACVRLPVVDV